MIKPGNLCLVYIYVVTGIEIINNTRGDIEAKIWEGGEFKSRMFTHLRCPRQKSHFRRVFLLFVFCFLKCFSSLKY